MGLSSRSCFCPMQKTTAASFSIQIGNVNSVDQLAEWPSRNTALPGSRFPYVIRKWRIELRNSVRVAVDEGMSFQCGPTP